MEEIWTKLNLEGCETKYKISSYGRVYNNHTKTFVSPVLTGKPKYWYVNLQPIEGKRVLRRVHVLMLLSFRGDPEDTDYTGDHIDRNKYNNTLWNLRWASTKTQLINRGNTIWVVHKGVTMSLMEAIEDCGIVSKIEKGFVRGNVFRTGDFQDALLKLILRKRLGDYTHKVVWNGRDCYLKDVCDLYEIDYNKTLQRLNNGWSEQEIRLGFKFKKPAQILQTDTMYFPNIDSFQKHYHISDEKRKELQPECSSLQEIADLHKAWSEGRHRFELNGFYGTRKDHCDRYGTSVSRVNTIMVRNRLSFEDALLKSKPKRIIKHTINGITKRNKAWFEHFNIKPKSANNFLNKNKGDMRITLEHYGVDTSDMTIEKYV